MVPIWRLRAGRTGAAHKARGPRSPAGSPRPPAPGSGSAPQGRGPAQAAASGGRTGEGAQEGAPGGPGTATRGGSGRRGPGRVGARAPPPHPPGLAVARPRAAAPTPPSRGHGSPAEPGPSTSRFAPPHAPAPLRGQSPGRAGRGVRYGPGGWGASTSASRPGRLLCRPSPARASRGVLAWSLLSRLRPRPHLLFCMLALAGGRGVPPGSRAGLCGREKKSETRCCAGQAEPHPATGPNGGILLI